MGSVREDGGDYNADEDMGCVIARRSLDVWVAVMRRMKELVKKVGANLVLIVEVAISHGLSVVLRDSL